MASTEWPSLSLQIQDTQEDVSSGKMMQPLGKTSGGFSNKLTSPRRELAQSRPTLHDPMDCSLPGSSIHGIFQATVLEWGAIAISVNLIKFSQKEKTTAYMVSIGSSSDPSV